MAAWSLGGSGRRLVGETIVYGGAGVIGKVAALLTVPVLTRALSADGYGVADLATSLAAFLTLAVRFGGEMPAGRLRAAATDPEVRRSVMGTFVLTTAVVSTLAAAALLPFSALIAEQLWASPASTPLAFLSLLLVPISAVQVALVVVHRYERRSRSVVLLTSIDLFAQLALAVLFVLMGMGPAGVVVGFLLGSALGLLAAAYSAAPYVSRRVSARVAISLVRDGLPYLPSVVGFVAADQVARLLAANWLGPAEVGHLALAIRLASVLGLASAAFTMAWGPDALARELSARTQAAFGRAFLVFTAAAATVAVGTASLGPELAIVVGGGEFGAAAAALPGLLWAAAIGGTLFILATAAGITNRGAAVAFASLAGAAAQIVMTVWLIPGSGILGIGLAAAAGRLVALCLLWLAVRDVVRPSARSLFLFAGASALLVFIQLLVARPEESLIMRWVIAAAMLYVGLVASLRWSSRPLSRASPV